MRRSTIISIGLAVLVVVGLLAASSVRNKQKIVKSTEQIQKEQGISVKVAPATFGTISDSIPVTGSLTALDSLSLSSKIMGRVAMVTVREGDPVSAGQVIVQLDQTDQMEALKQASAGESSAVANVAAANARLNQAITSRDVTESQTRATIEQAKAGLNAAKATYDKVKSGARTQERVIAKNAVATAQANLENAQASLKRSKQLVTQGAISQAQYDVAKTQHDVALAQYNTAKENLSLVEEGARNEDLRAAEAQVRQAKEALTMARANASQTQLREQDITSAKSAVMQAQAMLVQARANVALAQQQLSNTVIRSTINGFVSKRMTEPGQTVSPGMPVMEVVNVKNVYYQADISEKILSEIRPGQEVVVKVDAFPETTFEGKVAQINPAASISTRNFSVRINIPNRDGRLRPGMFARGRVVTSAKSDVLLVPQEAVDEKDGRTYVFTVEKVGKNEFAKSHIIRKGMSNADFVEVLPPVDISDQASVVTTGHEYLDVKKDTKVSVKE